MPRLFNIGLQLLYGEGACHTGYIVASVNEPALIFGDVVGALLCQRLVDAGLVNAVQQGFQGSHILNVGFL